MQIILLQDVKNIGKKGQIKNVPDGYARNFLLARKMAAAATPSEIAKIKQMEEAQKKQTESEKNAVQKLAATINGKRIVIKARAKNGRLFGSITAKEISSAIMDAGFSIPEKAIKADHIKELGEKNVSIDFDFGITAKIILTVEQE